MICLHVRTDDRCLPNVINITQTALDQKKCVTVRTSEISHELNIKITRLASKSISSLKINALLTLLTVLVTTTTTCRKGNIFPHKMMSQIHCPPQKEFETYFSLYWISH